MADEVEYYTDSDGQRKWRWKGSKTGDEAPNTAGQHDKGLAEEAGIGQRDPYAPELSDFPNPGGLGGAAEQNKALKEALAKYKADPEFKKQFTAAKRKAAEEAKAAQMAKTNRKGMQ